MQASDNLQLKKKFQRKQTFYHEMQGISKKFFEFEQQVFYSPVKDINPKMIIKIEGKTEQRAIFKREDFYLINGQYQPTGDRSFEKLILQIVQSIPRPNRSFGIIYINTFAAGDAYNDFKKVMELLPFEYLSNLTKVYVLQASFMNKAFFWLSFGTITNYVKNKTVNVDTLKEMEKLARFQPEMLKKILPANVVEELSKYEEPKEVPKRNLRTQPEVVSHVQQQEHQHPQPKYSSAIFGSTAQTTKKSNKKLITDYELGPTGAPKILQLLIYYFKNREESLKTEGIFRKSVSIDDETQILLELQNKNYNFLETVQNPHIIANALKRFLSNLRVPIISYQLFQMLMASDNQPNFVQIVIETIQNLSKINKMSIFLLFSFIRKVILYSQHNKMGENNICIVFGPCLLRAEVSSIKDLIYAKKVIVTTSIIYQQFQVIFGDLHSRNLLKRNSYIEYRKDQILQKLNRSPQSSKKSGEVEQQQPILLDKTSQFIKEALQQKQQNNYYLQTAEAEEAINQIPSQSAKSVEKYYAGKVEEIIDVVIHPQQAKMHQISGKGAQKTSEYTQI